MCVCVCMYEYKLYYFLLVIVCTCMCIVPFLCEVAYLEMWFASLYGRDGLHEARILS